MPHIYKIKKEVEVSKAEYIEHCKEKIEMYERLIKYEEDALTKHSKRVFNKKINYKKVIAKIKSEISKIKG